MVKFNLSQLVGWFRSSSPFSSSPSRPMPQRRAEKNGGGGGGGESHKHLMRHIRATPGEKGEGGEKTRRARDTFLGALEVLPV